MKNFGSESFRLILTVIACTSILTGCSNGEEDELSVPVENTKMRGRIERTPESRLWEFNSLDGWEDASQMLAERINYRITRGLLHIYTRANTWDRAKVRTIENSFTDGIYTWRVFVPEMGVGDRASAGAFLYYDDAHELDFEIGYGTSDLREDLNAQEDELIVFVTSQNNPFFSINTKVKRNNWYTLGIELEAINSGRNYYATWTIDGNRVWSQELDYGRGIPFRIFCSMENLRFMGDHKPTQNNYALFDYVRYDP